MSTAMRTRVPVLAIALQGAAAAVIALSGRYEVSLLTENKTTLTRLPEPGIERWTVYGSEGLLKRGPDNTLLVLNNKSLGWRQVTPRVPEVSLPHSKGSRFSGVGFLGPRYWPPKNITAQIPAAMANMMNDGTRYSLTL